MEKKLAVIVDNNKEVTTEAQNTEMCSLACDVAVETCSSQSHDACGMRHIATKGDVVKLGILLCVCMMILTMGALAGCSGTDEDTE